MSIEQRTLLSEFQVMVEELRDRGFSDVDVHSIVNMIWQGWMVRGQPTEEYLKLALTAVQNRKTIEEIPKVFLDAKGRPFEGQPGLGSGVESRKTDSPTSP